MKFIWAVLITVCALSATYGLHGQSRPGQLPTEGKVNNRPPTPTPTPLPGTVANVVDDGEVIKVNTQLVSVPVRVMDKKGRFIGGLTKESFTVSEDGVEQEIAL